MNRQKDFALITGGSHGIGRAMAEECLRRGIGVAILALPDAHLDQVMIDFADQNAVFLGINLIEEDAPTRVVRWLEEQDVRLKYLINNVGFGRGGCFEAVPLKEYQLMLRLNNQVMVDMTYTLLPQLKASQGAILNVSSMEATLPLPYKTVYTGTKGFIYNFSLALREEFRYYQISVSALCPGPVLTNEDGLKRVQAQGWKAKLLLKLPADIAPPAISGMLKGKAVIVPGTLPKILVTLGYYIPRSLRLRLLEKLFRKYRDNPSEVVASEEVVNP
ncbi:MAG: SDR family NAD(P)-dependent oxidoreductase [Bacteroidota bacterium]